MLKEFHISKNKSTLAKNIASDLKTRIEILKTQIDTINISLTGGTIGILMLEEFSKLNFSDDFFDKINWFWGDERFLKFEDPDRNDFQAFKAFFNKFPKISQKNIFSFPYNEDNYLDNLDLAAKDFENSIKNIIKEPKLKSFDIQILGMGPDGHINSIFPNKNSLNETSKIIISEHDSPKPPSQRLTFTLPVVNAASESWLIVSGVEKAEILASVVNEENKNLPASKIATKILKYYFDQDANSILKK